MLSSTGKDSVDIPEPARHVPGVSAGSPLDTNVVSRIASAPPAWAPEAHGLQRHDSAVPPRHLHVVPSLNLGGAERIVAEVAATLSGCGAETEIAVMREAASEHPLDAPLARVHRLGHRPWSERVAVVAGLALATRLPAYCHLTSNDELSRLWGFGVRTVPVVHNATAGWKEDPLAWNGREEIPFVVACGDLVARDLKDAGLRKPVRVIRHVVRPPRTMDAARRAAVREAFGARPGTLLIGMTGRHAVQKRYVKAVRVLAELLRRGTDARLVVVGAAPGEEGLRCRVAMELEAARLRVRHALVVAGAVADAADLVPAYNVLLNTSLWEGVSISTMEAVAAGVPVVASDVGGQREAVGPRDVLLPADAPEAEWADAVEQAPFRPSVAAAAREALRAASAHLWPWTMAVGPGTVLPRPKRGCDVLFVTGDMDVGGAQRSLCNLAAELPSRGVTPLVAVCGPIGVPGFMQPALDAGVEFLDLSGSRRDGSGLRGRMGRILSLVAERAPRTLCFWNMDAATKMAVAKALEGGPVRVADVSPGPMLYSELDAETEVGRTLSTSPDAYVASLDLLVSKYTGGGPAEGRARARGFAVIPNGVRGRGEPLPPLEGPRPPPGADPALAVVTVGRLAPAKRPELLPLVAAELGRLVPGATLTVVGGTHGTDPGGAWARMMDRCGGAPPPNLRFHGPDDRTVSFLDRFACFYMVSTDQGCPNASLEAMACGLPVVANPDGGTAEQVEHGLNGLLVADPGDEDAYAASLARALADVLLDPARATAMGDAGRARAAERFSMAAMADAYVHALLGAGTENPHA